MLPKCEPYYSAPPKPAICIPKSIKQAEQLKAYHENKHVAHK